MHHAARKHITATATINSTGSTAVSALASISILAGADAATAIVYDGESTAGDIIAVVGAGIGLSAENVPSIPISVNSGNIHIVVTGTTPDVVVSWV